MPITPIDNQWPYEVSANSGSSRLKMRIEGSWNRKIHNINADHEIPLGIDMEVTDAEYYGLDFNNELHCEKCKLTDPAIEQIDDSYIIGLSVEKLRGWRTPEHEPPFYPNWALIGNEDGFIINPDGSYDRMDLIPFKMGAKSTDNDFTVHCGFFKPIGCYGTRWGEEFHDQESNPLDTADSYLGRFQGVMYVSCSYNYGTWYGSHDIVIKTELPVFDTDAHLLAFIRSNGTVTEGLLNGEQSTAVDNDNEYDYYLNNIYTKYRAYGMSYETKQKYSYQFKIVMEKRGKVIGGLLALVNDRPFEPEDRNPRKYHLIGDAIRSVITWDGEQYVEYTGDDIKNLTFYRTSAGKAGFDYTQVQTWSTNIPFKDGADSENWARQFLETGNPRGATNEKKIKPKDTPITPGTPVEETPIPTPGFTISNGGRILGLTAAQVNTFYSKIFNPADIQALLDGTQLFGSNQINSIKDLFYIPVSIEDIATCSSTQHIFLGSYDLDMGSSVKWVTNNNKLINCGTVDFHSTFDSYLDYEPFCTLFIWLPFCGIHKLEVSKYINKTIHLRYAVSVFDGTCVAFLSTVKGGHDVVLDSFQGNMSVHRPLQANDQQRQTTAIAQGILQTGAQVVGTLGSVVAGAGAIGSAASLGGIEAGVAAGVGQGVASGLPGANGAIRTGANTLQTAVDAPMSTRGALAGMLSMFDTMIPTFIVARLNSIEPENELEIVGKPSATGGKVGSFAGFLKTSAFDMPNFPGTIEEAQEIQNMFRGGVYVD